MKNLPDYKATAQSLWQGRNDTPPDERFFQRVRCVDARSFSFSQAGPKQAFLGFCCDEGIRRNEGRVGARLGPDSLRKQLAKLAIHQDKHYIDLGNIECRFHQLESAQEQFAALITQCHRNQLFTIALGGGHEIAWAHFQGLAPIYPRLAIINFDAHFDIRPTTGKQQGNSGTPFAQIKEYCDENHREFHYCCLGIQSFANTKSLFSRAKDWNISYLTATQLNQEPLSTQIAFINQFMHNHEAIYLSICLDVFDECFAPGVSAPQSMGVSPLQSIPLLKYIMQSGKVISIDVAELSPSLDENDKTSRLAARLLAELI